MIASAPYRNPYTFRVFGPSNRAAVMNDQVLDWLCPLRDLGKIGMIALASYRIPFTSTAVDSSKRAVYNREVTG